MSIVTPSKERHSSYFRKGSLTIVIPAPRSLEMLFWGGWLVFWGITFLWGLKFGILFTLVLLSEQVTIKALFVPLFFIFWLFAWGRAGLRMMGKLLWNLFGEEEIRIDEHFVSIRRVLFGKAKAKLYRGSLIERWRVSCQSTRAAPLGSKTTTCLAFDYGADTIRFGEGISEAEAYRILQKIVESLPVYKDKIIVD